EGGMSIGEFSQASRLSPKALRLYDELGLLEPARVDPYTGYRWYAPGQLERARLVAALRRLAVPLAEIKQIVDLPADQAVERLGAFWARADADHAAKRELLLHVVRGLSGEEKTMYEVEVRQVPERRLLSLLKRVHENEVVAVSRATFLVPLREAGLPRIEGVDGASFVIYHGEVSADSDGPIEWCRPLPHDAADAAAARFPQFQLRTEPAHEEAFVHRGDAATWSATDAELAFRAILDWAAQHGREPGGAVRVAFIADANTAASGHGPDGEFVVPLK
ncbi:MAG TPA: helix-turn-helix domain-containing protein, partial [Acidimicrobiales bacterium]|nr:helix-turn-helix domain-containing protein [Acidimicrobiales bacterium]